MPILTNSLFDAFIDDEYQSREAPTRERTQKPFATVTINYGGESYNVLKFLLK